MPVRPRSADLDGRELRHLRQSERFETLLAADRLEVMLAGIAHGERVECHREIALQEAQVPNHQSAAYAFLEPRALAIDRVTIEPATGGGPILPRRGVFPVYGGQSHYVFSVEAPDQSVTAVNVLRLPGEVEVETLGPQGKVWTFLLTVVADSWLTYPVRLDYDVKADGRCLRGEVYLSIRPTNWRHWQLALGAALTIMGAVAVVPPLLEPAHVSADVLEATVELMRGRWADLLQLACIPLIRVGLGLVDRLIRPFREV